MFHSTRGIKLVSAHQAILDGMAEDGGLYVIDKFPSINYKDYIYLDYVTLATKIIHLFFSEFDYQEIKKEIEEAYRTFDDDKVVPMKHAGNASFLELFHGPTSAFKDLALVILPRLMKLSQKKAGGEQKLTILTATSGDTGGAALSGFKNIEGISIVVLYPNQGVSYIQEAQMNSFKSSNACVLAYDGNFDDCQRFVKEYFQEHPNQPISSANSINIARLVPQIVYYFYAYGQLIRDGKITCGDKVNFSVPTGNFGNILAGFFAKKLGLPVANLICASNKNDVLTEFFSSGKYIKNRPFYKTNSPSMDILISSNLERWLYYASSEKVAVCKELMTSLSTNGYFEYQNPYPYFFGYSCDEEETLKQIKRVYEQHNYLIDPHTAVGFYAYERFKKECPEDLNHTVVLSTAAPFKFAESVLKAFGIEKTAVDAVAYLSSEFHVALPRNYPYQTFQREVVNKDEAKRKIGEMILCTK